jgi:hypothetical protein
MRENIARTSDRGDAITALDANTRNFAQSAGARCETV